MLTIYKNLKSGKHFILINEIDADIGLFITPQGKEKPLEFKLFQEDSFEDDEKNLLDNGIVTPEQVIRYELHNKDRADEGTDNLVDIIIEEAQLHGRINALLDYINELEKEKGNDKLLIKLREKILEEL